MKLLLLTFLISCITINGYSQSLNDIKKDSIVKIENTDLSLIYYKKTTAVWHNFANFYVVEPTKNWFIYLHSAELLVEVDFKHKTFYAIVEDELTGGYKQFLIGKNEIHGDIVYAQTPESITTSKEIYREYIQIDTSFYSKSLKKITKEINGDKVGEYKLEFESKLLFVTNYKNNYEKQPYLFPEVIESIKYPGEDSITNYGDVIYHPPATVKRVSKSGVYNNKCKKWILEPSNHFLYKHKNNLLISKENDSLKHFSTGYYSIFEIKKNKLKIINKKITKPNIEIIEKFTDFDSIQQKGVYHFITFKNNKQGFIRFQLFNHDNVEYYYNDLPHCIFNKSELEKPINDFIYFNPVKKKSLVKKDSIFFITEYNWDDEIINYYSGVAQKTQNICTGSMSITRDIRTMETIRKTFSADECFHFKMINDTLLIMIDFVPENSGEYLISIQYPGEDSVSTDGNIVLDITKPIYKTGLYNLNSKKWIINPDKIEINYFKGRNFLVKLFDSTDLTTKYDIQNYYGQIINDGLSKTNLFQNKSNVEKLLLNSTNQTLELASDNYFSNKSVLKFNANYVKQYYIIENNKRKLIEFGINHQTKEINYYEVTNTFHDLIIQNNNLGYSITLNDNKTQVKLNFIDTTITYNSTRNSFDFTAHVQGMDRIESYHLEFNDKDNSNIYDFKEESGRYIKYRQPNQQVIDRIIKTNDKIVIMKTPSINSVYYTDFHSEYDSYQWETEESEIWTKTDGIWKKSTTSYATIEPTKFGYICKTGYLDLGDYQDDNLNIKNVNSTYIILDENLKPINFADYYNFELIESYKFGYVITENSANKYTSFLVNLDGKAVTDAKYQSFSMIEGNLYGVTKEGREIIK